MKLTKSQLKQIIKEELSAITEARPSGEWPGGPGTLDAVANLAMAIAKDENSVGEHKPPVARPGLSRDPATMMDIVGRQLVEFVKETFYKEAPEEETIDI